MKKEFNATIYLSKIFGAVFSAVIVIAFVSYFVFGPIKAEHKIKSGLTKMNIQYSKIKCDSGFGIDCKIYDFKSATPNGFTFVKELELVNVEKLRGFSVPKFTGTVNLEANGIGLYLVNTSKYASSPLIKNFFNDSNIVLNLDVKYKNGVATYLHIKNINLTLPKGNTTISFSSEIFNIKTKPYFSFIKTNFKFKNIKDFIYSSYLAMISNKSPSEIEQYNINSFNKKKITSDDSYSSFVDYISELQKENKYKDLDPLYTALKNSQLKKLSIDILNPKKKDFNYLVTGLMYGSLLNGDLNFNIKTK